MLLSILIPSFNQARYLRQTLDSCLSQSYRPFEIIVADGGSTDGTVDILREYAARHPQIRWSSEEDRGPAEAVNKALALANGEIAGIQSSDDVYDPGAFDAVMPVFRQHPDVGFVIGDYRGFDDSGQTLYVSVQPDFSWEAYFALSLSIPQSSIFFRTRIARAVGGWNPRYYSPDIEFWLKILLRTRAMHVSTVLSGWRIYPGQRTHSPGARQRIWEGYWQMLEQTPELRAAPRRIRRLARASAHLLALRFHPGASRREIQFHLLNAFLLHPTFWRYYPWELRKWLPGAAWLPRKAAPTS